MDASEARGRTRPTGPDEVFDVLAPPSEYAPHGDAHACGSLDHLLPVGWFSYGDRRRLRELGADVDHVLAGPAGVVVVRCEPWVDTVVAEDRVRTAGQVREREVAAAADGALRVADLLPPEFRDGVGAILCVDGPDGLHGHARGVQVCDGQTLPGALTARRPVLCLPEVSRLCDALRRTFPRDDVPAFLGTDPAEPEPLAGADRWDVLRDRALRPPATVPGTVRAVVATVAALIVISVFMVMASAVSAAGRASGPIDPDPPASAGSPAAPDD